MGRAALRDERAGGRRARSLASQRDQGGGSMIGLPFNDEACLGAITELIAGLVESRDEVLVQLAERHPTTDELQGWLRSLPQRDDLGRSEDVPKVEACSPPQRLRIAPDDPNCLERAALYLAVAELKDPRPVRQL